MGDTHVPAEIFQFVTQKGAAQTYARASLASLCWLMPGVPTAVHRALTNSRSHAT
jgi:hypothetical protein